MLLLSVQHFNAEAGERLSPFVPFCSSFFFIRFSLIACCTYSQLLRNKNMWGRARPASQRIWPAEGKGPPLETSTRHKWRHEMQGNGLRRMRYLSPLPLPLSLLSLCPCALFPLRCTSRSTLLSQQSLLSIFASLSLPLSCSPSASLIHAYSHPSSFAFSFSSSFSSPPTPHPAGPFTALPNSVIRSRHVSASRQYG